jgi:hypothetical protein
VTLWRKNLRRVCLISAAGAGLSIPLLFFLADRAPDAVDVAKAFYKANYARDFEAASAYLSAADREISDQAGYLYRDESYGFALELAKRFADQIKFHVTRREISADRARLTLEYKIPAPDELSSLLFGWNQARLNPLSGPERRRITAALENLDKSESSISIEGRETFILVKENGQWKIFLDWASATPVFFNAVLPVENAIEVEFLQRRIFAGKNEPFESNLKLRNRSPREIVARIEHRIEPKEFSDDITMIACGFLRPLTLRPGEERQISSAYLLDPRFPRNKPLSIAYQFHVQSPPPRLRQ